MIDIRKTLAAEFRLNSAQVAQTAALIEDGNSIPFIARYRKEATGGIDDATLREFDKRLAYLKNLETRKNEVLKLIYEQGKLTEELAAEIERSEVLQRVEDLYKPYKKKRATRASKARDAGLEPLALIILEQGLTSGDPLGLAMPYVNPEKGYDTADAALGGACDIIAEQVADDAEFTALLRDYTRTHGRVASIASDENEKTVYEMYYDFGEPVTKIPNHRILAINRGEKEGKLRVKVEADPDYAVGLLEKRVIKHQGIFADLLKTTLNDSYKRLIAPSLEREVRAELTERAESEAIKVFARNTENLLLIPPVKGARIIAIDPGYRTGCKVAVLDERGKLLDFTTIYPTPPKSDVMGAQRVLQQFAVKHNVNIIVIGNGTGSRETEEAVADFIAKSGLAIQYTIVNEAGASVYSASELASKEYPDLDVSTRGAMSLGRRLQDPLAELVKIPPKSIGVGQYQHDLNQTALDHALTGVVESAVNRVGVDLNTASASLLSYVAGIGSALASNIAAYRDENGIFNDRKQLKKVPKLGAKAFQQCAGFLRISGGKNPLDSTAVHPESYAAAKELLNIVGVKATSELSKGGIPDIADRAGDLRTLSERLGIGLPTLQDIVSELMRPGRDPREDAPPVVFSSTVRSLEDLAVGMELTGTVRNVVDFGAFVDIGVKQDGLVHISKIANRYIRHPSEVVAVGDNIKVWVAAIDTERGKVSLTMINNA